MSALEAIYYIASTLPERERAAFTAETIAKFKAAGGAIADGETPHVAEPRPVAANLKAAARELAATKRGPRVKADPRLPAKAPEIYKKRVRREELGWKKENIIQFVERVYAPWRKILARADLRRLDETADAAVERWISRKRPLPEGLLLTEYELNTDKRQLEANQPPRKPKQQFARMLREGVRAAG